MRTRAEKISRFDIRQFRPAIYWLICLGVAGFAFAADSAAVWVLTSAAILMHAWLTSTGRFRPISRLVANLVTVTGMLVLFVVIQRSDTAPLLLIGHFLALLQMVKLYEQRANRDYAQLLVLSLLLMVAAGISTASVIFGMILIGYLVLALYCCLLFHLKIEAEHAAQMSGFVRGDSTKLAPATAGATLDGSMRKLVVLIILSAILCAAATFYLFPRGSGAALFGRAQFRASQSLTGFNESVSFQNVAKITQNNDEVAKVVVDRMGMPYQGVLLLRGVTLDWYTGDGKGLGLLGADVEPHQWIRSSNFAGGKGQRGGSKNRWVTLKAGNSTALYHQQVTLNPTGTTAIFALGGIVSFMQESDGDFRYSAFDEAIQSADPLTQKIRYEVTSDGVLTGDLSDNYFSSIRSKIDEQIKSIALREDVSGKDDAGVPLAPQRPLDAMVTPLDSQIAKNIETYLKKNYTYTLDLGDAVNIGDKEPLVAFLTDFKRGHCEYFAGAMALMCQSLGLRARVVVGFKCDEYNAIGDYFTVRQSHAHAWVEVLNSSGVWEVFDPTSSNEEVSVRMDTLWQRLRAVLSYLEYQWDDAIIAYDQSRRSNLLMALDHQARVVVHQVADAADQAWHWQGKVFVTVNILNTLIVLILVVLASAISWFFWEKTRLRRRARRIGLDALPLPEQLKLARQLRFYDEMIRLLERHGILRPTSYTPLEFSGSLSYLPTEAFDSIRRLTDVYYRVRYGRTELSEHQQRELVHAIANVENVLTRTF